MIHGFIEERRVGCLDYSPEKLGTLQTDMKELQASLLASILTSSSLRIAHRKLLSSSLCCELKGCRVS